jgi:hypothetical protein
MEDPVAELPRTLRDVGILGADHPDVLENLFVTGVGGLNNQPAH